MLALVKKFGSKVKVEEGSREDEKVSEMLFSFV